MIENNYNLKCPICELRLIITSIDGIYFIVITANCIIEEFLYNTDKHWKITNKEQYIKRLSVFLTTDEYKTIIKNQIIKEL